MLYSGLLLCCGEAIAACCIELRHEPQLNVAVGIAHREKQFLSLLGLFLLAEIRISFDVDRASLASAMAAISAAHNYDTPMIIYQSDTSDDKAAEYVRGDIENAPKALVGMEKLAQSLTANKLVRSRHCHFLDLREEQTTNATRTQRHQPRQRITLTPCTPTHILTLTPLTLTFTPLAFSPLP